MAKEQTILLSIKQSISCSHHLPHYTGKCKNLHGHNWLIEVAIVGNLNPKTGMLMDFKQVKKTVNSVLEAYDHQDLNEFLENPTAENLAVQLMSKLRTKFIGEDCQVAYIAVEETPNCKITLSGGEKK